MNNMRKRKRDEGHSSSSSSDSLAGHYLLHRSSKNSKRLLIKYTKSAQKLQQKYRISSVYIVTRDKSLRSNMNVGYNSPHLTPVGHSVLVSSGLIRPLFDRGWAESGQ